MLLKLLAERSSLLHGIQALQPRTMECVEETPCKRSKYTLRVPDLPADKEWCKSAIEQCAEHAAYTIVHHSEHHSACIRFENKMDALLAWDTLASMTVPAEVDGGEPRSLSVTLSKDNQDEYREETRTPKSAQSVAEPSTFEDDEERHGAQSAPDADKESSPQSGVAHGATSAEVMERPPGQWLPRPEASQELQPSRERPPRRELPCCPEPARGEADQLPPAVAAHGAQGSEDDKDVWSTWRPAETASDYQSLDPWVGWEEAPRIYYKLWIGDLPPCKEWCEKMLSEVCPSFRGYKLFEVGHMGYRSALISFNTREEAIRCWSALETVKLGPRPGHNFDRWLKINWAKTSR